MAQPANPPGAPQPPVQSAQPIPGQPAQSTDADALRNLMVNYIPTTIDEMQLRQLFEMYGPIESIKIVCDRETRQSKGYGFVKYRFAFSAMHAIQYLNGYPLMNKRLKVAYANQAEAQKAAQLQNEGGAAAMNPYGGMPVGYTPQGLPNQGQGAEGDIHSQLWMQQMNYMQQVAALQMMQYQQMMMMNQQAQVAQGGQPPQGARPPSEH